MIYKINLYIWHHKSTRNKYYVTELVIFIVVLQTYYYIYKYIKYNTKIHLQIQIQSNT